MRAPFFRKEKAAPQAVGWERTLGPIAHGFPSRPDPGRSRYNLLEGHFPFVLVAWDGLIVAFFR